jgi:hypothetical protein
MPIKNPIYFLNPYISYHFSMFSEVYHDLCLFNDAP